MDLKWPSLASGPIRSLTSWYAKVLHVVALITKRANTGAHANTGVHAYVSFYTAQAVF